MTLIRKGRYRRLKWLENVPSWPPKPEHFGLSACCIDGCGLHRSQHAAAGLILSCADGCSLLWTNRFEELSIRLMVSSRKRHAAKGRSRNVVQPARRATALCYICPVLGNSSCRRMRENTYSDVIGADSWASRISKDPNGGW
jgi:hypothetical protein